MRLIIILLSLSDLALSYLVLTPSDEANPLLSASWETFGYIHVVSVKLVTTTLAIYVMTLAKKYNERRAWWIACIFITGILIYPNALLIEMCYYKFMGML